MSRDALALARRAAEAVDPEYVARLAQRLVQIRSVYEPEQGNTEAEAARFVAEALRESGLASTLEDAAPGRPNVVADWQGSRFDPARHRTLLLEGHSDVVTEGDPELWTHPPFAGVIEDGKLYGRGACDMKAGVAAALGALKAVREVAPDLPGRIRLGVVADEEGMMLGVKHFIERGWAEEVSGAIICEPEENELCLFQKGALRVRVRFFGVMAHGAMPYAGVNPIAALGSFLKRLKGLEREEQARLGAHEHLGLPWLTPTVVRAPVQGEAQNNVMPESALLALDIRTVPGQEHGAILSALEGFAAALMDETPKLRVSVECFESRPPTETPPDDPLVRALEAVYPAVLGVPPRYGGVPGATDGTFLHAWAGVPIVTVGPGVRTVPHQRDEWVDLAEVAAAARLYAAAAVLYLSEDASSRT